MTDANNQPLISVVIVSYHSGPALFEAVRSALAQTVPLELLLIDNGNPPEVLARIKAIAAQDARLKLLSGGGNIGFSKGCNQGAKMAQGERLLFFNPDGMMPAGTLARLREYDATLKRPFMIGARLIDAEGRDQRGCRRALLTPSSAFVEALHLWVLFPHLRLNRHEEALPKILTPIPATSGAFMYMAREDFQAIGGFDEGYFLHVEDLDLCLRFRRAGGEIYFAPDLVVTHIGGTSLSKPGFIEYCKARGFVRYFHKNFRAQYPLPFLWLMDAAIWVRAGMRAGTSLFAAPKNKVL